MSNLTKNRNSRCDSFRNESTSATGYYDWTNRLVVITNGYNIRRVT